MSILASPTASLNIFSHDGVSSRLIKNLTGKYCCHCCWWRELSSLRMNEHIATPEAIMAIVFVLLICMKVGFSWTLATVKRSKKHSKMIIVNASMLLKMCNVRDANNNTIFRFRKFWVFGSSISGYSWLSSFILIINSKVQMLFDPSFIIINYELSQTPSSIAVRKTISVLD